MIMISKIVTISMIACFANATVTTKSSHKKSEKSAHKEGCYIKEINNVVPPGTRVNPIGYCYGLHCKNTWDPDFFVVSKLDCAEVSPVNKRCRFKRTDLTKPYPACCPYYICDKENYY